MLPDPQFQPLKVLTSIPVRSSTGVPPPGGLKLLLLNQIHCDRSALFEELSKTKFFNCVITYKYNTHILL